MKYILLIITGLIFLFLSCSKTNQQLAPELLQKQMTGVWSGLILGENRNRISLTYYIYPNHEFSMKLDTAGFWYPHPKTGYYHGKWSLSADSVLDLSLDENLSQRLYFNGKWLNKKNNIAEKNNPDDFYNTFKKVKLSDSWSYLSSHGYTFVAYGFQPEWQLQINGKDSPWFSVEGKIVSIPNFSSVFRKKDSRDEFIIETSNSENKMIIQATKETYQDSIYAINFPWKVHISLKGKDGKALEFNGGGKNIYEFNLEGRWYLSSVDNLPLEWSIFPPDKPRPYIQFDPYEMSISGFAGCNDFNGKYEADKNLLVFDQVSVNQLVCSKRNFEKRFVRKLKEGSFKWEVRSGKLSLASAKGVMSFSEQENWPKSIK